ncbi:MAG: antibiotic biosynthesis monooxygenase [Actinobacteria bacterium]|nr:antibiotic biosynthesis monooxygenase [Actinomycetota bacterium]
MLLICRFAVEPAEAENFVARARRALGLLTAQPGCLGGQLGRSPDEVTRWVLVVRFDSVVAYRRALSPFEVREHVIPLLSEALTSEPGGYEVLASAELGTVAEHGSLLAGATDRATPRESRRGNGPGAR